MDLEIVMGVELGLNCGAMSLARLYSSRHIRRNAAVLSLSAVAAFLASCERFEEQFDLFGRYKACMTRLAPVHAQADAQSALSRRDFHLYFSNIRGFASGNIALGIKDCQPASGRIVELKIDLPVSPTKTYFGNSPAANCSGAVEKYKEVYNMMIFRSNPRQASLNCI